jgi:hypothetical protein
VNHYKVPRLDPASGRGYWVLPAVEDVMGRAQDRWEEALERIVNRYTGRG